MELMPEARSVFHVQSYAPTAVIDGVQIVELRHFGDDGGSTTEFGRLSEADSRPCPT